MSVSAKRVGQILRETREEKNLSVKDVSKDTNIAMKFILALESEDYSLFPAETFTIGFLKTYSDYLKLDTSHMLNLYRGEQEEESQLPLEELTKPTVKMLAVELEKNRALLPIIIVILVLGGILGFSYLYDTKPGEEENSNPNSLLDEGKFGSFIPSDVKFESQTVLEGSSVPFTLTPDQGFTFSVNNQQCKIFIKGVEKGSSDENIAVIGFNVFPDKKVYFFKSKVNEESLLSYNNPELESLRREIKVLTQAITENSAKVLITLSDERAGSPKKPSGDVPIQVTLFFIKASYAEFIIDGQTGERGLISAGETKQLEAKDRLEIKVGDGGAVDMVQNGKERIKMGRPGKLTRKIYFKAPSPYDSTQFIIKEMGD
jgi:transcriptional regulator with XRE-family HTH domain